MGDEKVSPEPKLSDIHDRLQSGIETCRSVIDNYRSLLTEDQHALEASGAKDVPADPAHAPHGTRSK